MAIFPCDRGPHISPGRNSLFYVSVGAGSYFDRWKLRLCQDHTTLVQDNLAQQEVGLIQLAGGITDAHTHCLTCRQPLLEAGHQVFVTGYPSKDERKDYWARIHQQCAVPAYLDQADDFFGWNGEHKVPTAAAPGRHPPAAEAAPKASKKP